jgi:hypothetical protein
MMDGNITAALREELAAVAATIVQATRRLEP